MRSVWAESKEEKREKVIIIDKLIKKDKKKIDKMMSTLIKKDIPRDAKLHKCDKLMKKKKR